MVDDFEIVPEKEVSNLKKEINKLKQDPLGESEAGSKMYKTMDNLNESMTNMLNLFKIAADSMQQEEKEEVFLAEKIKPLFEKVDKVVEQNEKIAKALVAIADMIDDLKNNKPEDPVGDLRNNVNPNMQNNINDLSQNSFSNNQFQQNNSQQQNMGQLQQNSSQQNNSQNGNGMNFQASQGSPSPFLDDDNSQGLPSFSDFNSQNNVQQQNFQKMQMPPPPNMNQNTQPKQEKKGGLFGHKK